MFMAEGNKGPLKNSKARQQKGRTLLKEYGLDGRE